jgi:hypothetical protein
VGDNVQSSDRITQSRKGEQGKDEMQTWNAVMNSRFDASLDQSRKKFSSLLG